MIDALPTSEVLRLRDELDARTRLAEAHVAEAEAAKLDAWLHREANANLRAIIASRQTQEDQLRTDLEHARGAVETQARDARAAEAKVAELTTELTATKARIERAEAARDKALHGLRYANDRLVPLESELHRTKGEVAELVERHRELALRTVIAEGESASMRMALEAQPVAFGPDGEYAAAEKLKADALATDAGKALAAEVEQLRKAVATKDARGQAPIPK